MPGEHPVDPEFVPEVGMPPYDNQHTISLPYAPGSTPAGGRGVGGRAGLVLLPLIGGWIRRARAR